MSITLSFNQILAAILVLMLAVLLVSTIILFVRISKTADRIDRISDDVSNVTGTVNDAAAKITDKLVSNFTNLSQLAVTAAVFVLMFSVDRAVRTIIKKK